MLGLLLPKRDRFIIMVLELKLSSKRQRERPGKTVKHIKTDSQTTKGLIVVGGVNSVEAKIGLNRCIVTSDKLVQPIY